jgi:hypothetical protein
MGMSDGQFATFNSSVYLGLSELLEEMEKLKGTEHMQKKVLNIMEMLKSSSKGSGYFPPARKTKAKEKPNA